MKQRLLVLIGLILVIVGLYAGYPIFRQSWQDKTIAFDNSGTVYTDKPVAPNNQPTIVGTPNRVVIKSLNIDLAVAEGRYNPEDQSWTLSSDKAHFAELSAKINNKAGNTLLYGHNTKQLLGGLNRIEAGDRVEVYTDNNYKFVYSYKTAVETGPQDSSVFNYNGPAMLTLQTCSGLWDQNRQLFAFDFVEVQRV